MKLSSGAMAFITALALAACGADEADQSADGEADDAANAEDWEPEYVDGVLQPLPDGFPDQELTVVIADPPGSEEGLIVQKMIELIGDKSPVPIRLEAREDFISIPTWEALEYAGTDGYRQVIYSAFGSTADVVGAPVTEATGLTWDDVAHIVTIEERPYFMTQCTDVPWEPTIESLVEYTKEHPGEVKFAAQGAGAGTDLAFMHYMNELGAGEIEYITVGSTEDTSGATAACETDVTITSVGVILPHVQADRLDVLMVTQDEAVEEFPDVRTAADLGFENDVMGGVRMVVTRTGVDPLRIQWLYELYGNALQDPEFEEFREAQPSINVNVMGPDEARELDRGVLEIVDQLLRDLGLHIEQQ